MSEKNKKLTFIDLFAGCGGLSEGFLQTNQYDALAHVEWEIPMVNTLRNRLEKKWKHNTKESYKKVIQNIKSVRNHYKGVLGGTIKDKTL